MARPQPRRARTTDPHGGYVAAMADELAMALRALRLGPGLQTRRAASALRQAVRLYARALCGAGFDRQSVAWLVAAMVPPRRRRKVSRSGLQRRLARWAAGECDAMGN